MGENATFPKKTLAALEKVFVAEIENRLPFQSRAKVYERLCDEGLLAPMQRVFGASDRFPVTVSGYQLTHAGRIVYCSDAADHVDAKLPR